MKNITVSVDDEVYHRAKVRAAEMRTSLSAIVRRVLCEISGEETEFERYRRMELEWMEKLRQRGGRFSGADRLPRDEVHDRNAFH